MKKEETLKKQIDEKKHSRKKYIIAAGILLLIVIVFAFWLLSWEPKPDPASEKVIRQAAAMMLSKNSN